MQAISVIGVDAKSTASLPGFQAWIDSVANRIAFFGHVHFGTPTQGILLIPQVCPALAVIVECPVEEVDRAEQVLQQFGQSICLNPVLILCQKC